MTIHYQLIKGNSICGEELDNTSYTNSKDLTTCVKCKKLIKKYSKK